MTSPDVDDVAVELACDGDRTVPLNAAEMSAAVDLCQRRGMSDHATGLTLGVAARTVAAVRSGAPVRRLTRTAPKATPRPSEATFLTVAEVARQLRVSKMTIYRLIEGGELGALRIGHSYRVPGKALADYLRDAHNAA